MTPLEPGTVIEFDAFTAVVVGENTLFVFESSSSFVFEGAIIHIESRGSNDWIISLSEDDWSSYDYWIKRDWNDNVSAREFDEWDCHTWPDEWDDDLDDWLQSYEEYDY